VDLEYQVADRLRVQFGIDQNQVREAFTADISTAECIFDLIDNSIDAARDALLEGPNVKLDRFNLPASYSGHKINLHITPTTIAIRDNSYGMNSTVLGREAFFSGNRHTHKYGIGYFGLGLIRAVLKLAREVRLKTSNGKEAYYCKISEAQIQAPDQNEIYADPISNSGKIFNILVLSDIPEEISYEIRNSRWKETLINTINKRYGIYIRKGLEICVNGTKLPPFGPSLRDHPNFSVYSKQETLGNGVIVNIDIGADARWKFKGEDGFTQTCNKSLAIDSGLYAVCNDRIIRIADKGEQTDWFQKWHGEYNSLIGWIHFVSKNPSLLPWDSKKANLNTNNVSYQETADQIREVGDEYRSQNRKLLKGEIKKEKDKIKDKENKKPVEPKPPIPPNIQNTNQKPQQGGKIQISPTENVSPINHTPNPANHNKDYDFLMWRCTVNSLDKKTLALVNECQRLCIRDYPYASAMLLRNTVESVIEDYLKRSGFWHNACEYEVKRRNRDREKRGHAALNPQEARNAKPNLSEMLKFFNKEQRAVPGNDAKTLLKSIQLFSNDLGELNGITHESILTTGDRVASFRERIVPSLEAMLAFSEE
tara:strand:- start:988 stop:2772 length:1785 start_codon:yes stop_codon:yes gene_type:complete